MILKKNNTPYNRHGIMWFLFIYVVLFNYIIANRFSFSEIDDVAIHSFYSVDFSYGFATGLLPGAIFNALFGKYASRNTATVFLTILMIFFFLGVSFLLERFINSMPSKYRHTSLLFVVLFLSGGYSFAVFTKTLGLLDSFWLFFLLLFFYFLDNHIMRYFIPLICCLCIMVHNGAVISYIPLMLVILFYRISILDDQKERKKYTIILLLSIVISISVFLFFLAFEKKMVCPISEFHEKLLSRGCTFTAYYDYAFCDYREDFDYSYFDIYLGEKYTPHYIHEFDSTFTKMFTSVYNRIEFNFRLLWNNKKIHTKSFLNGMLTLTPLYYFYIRFLGKRWKESTNPIRRICSILMIVHIPLMFISALLVSEDITRWMTHTFLIAFAYIAVILYSEKESCSQFFEMFKTSLSSLAGKVYCVFYATTCLLPIY